MKMKISRQRLKEIIKEEAYEVLPKRQDRVRKDNESRSKERRRNWLNQAGRKLGMGIIGEDDQPVEMFTEEFKSVMKGLEEDRVLNPQEFKKRCMKMGLRTINDFMRLQNLIKRSQDGDLVAKPTTKEELVSVDEFNKCGNRRHSSTTGHFTDKDDKGIDSSYFCDNEPRKKIEGGSIPHPRDCGASARREHPSKDRPCWPDNPKNKKKRKVE